MDGFEPSPKHERGAWLSASEPIARDSNSDSLAGGSGAVAGASDSVPCTSGSVAGGEAEALHCPHCDYNLTGLPQARCPECGRAFDLAEVRRRAGQRPVIAFERFRGGQKVPAFWSTWVCVLFVPWGFARQSVKRISVVQALLFALLCFATTSGILLIEGVGVADMWLTWVFTAAVYLPLQSALLALLDVPHWQRPLRSWGYWVAVTGYTSAVMVTEVWTGFPPIVWNDLVRLVLPTVSGSFSEPYELTLAAGIYWSQMVLWVTGVACCYYARVRQAGWARRTAVVTAVGVGLLLIPAYAAAVQFIGFPAYDLFD